jgi:hypothetical protein
MDIAIFDARELPFVLGALRRVALSNEVFSLQEARFVETLAQLHGQHLNADELPQVSFADVARVVTDPHRRKRVVQLAIIMSLVEGHPCEQSSRSVLELGGLLDVTDEGMRVLDKVAHSHAMLARFDLVRRVQRFISNRGGPGFLQVAVPALLGLGQDDVVARRYHDLAALPHDTFGYALYRHFKVNEFPMPGEKGGLPELMLFHDVGHVVSGYDVDPQGEIQQAAFQAGFSRLDGFVFLFFGILQFHIGLRITPVAKAEHGYFDVPKVLAALARGAACRVDFSDHFDFFQHAPRRLDELRTEWGVTPLGSLAVA